ncbi:MAG: acyl-CoA dehydratase activase [Deltaproteobacteria bacterium]|jgi:predicted CoA-substrate-specific enzyme activase|nr:acyl-CoA dehydratase activase [Deltaproteobacteria bacterium]
MKAVYLGIDVGSISTNLVLMDDSGGVLYKKYLRTHGQPMKAMQKGLMGLAQKMNGELSISGVGTTGSGRYLAGILVGADVIKNEITAHAVAALHYEPKTHTIIEIGGQDSKSIILRNGIVIDFAMNTVCAAGTGSFLDQQAYRLGIPIESFGEYALKARKPVKIASRCTVFAESDMIHKQQMGHSVEDIIAGLCEALVRNYLNNLVKSQELRPPILFQGGVAANVGMQTAFERVLENGLTVPPDYEVMGAIGAALLAKEVVASTQQTRFRGFEVGEIPYKLNGFECEGCSNGCEVMEVKLPIAQGQERLVRWGDRCGKWETGDI